MAKLAQINWWKMAFWANINWWNMNRGTKELMRARS